MRQLRRNEDPILPAGCLFSKLKVTIAEIRKEWEYGTVYVHRRGDKLKFVYSSGRLGKEHALGSLRELAHDQTHAFLGTWQIVSIVDYDKDTIRIEGEDFTAAKAAIAVYK